MMSQVFPASTKCNLLQQESWPSWAFVGGHAVPIVIVLRLYDVIGFPTKYLKLGAVVSALVRVVFEMIVDGRVNNLVKDD